MVTCDDVIVRSSKMRSGERKSFGFFFVVVLISCSLTAIAASGVSTTNTTAKPEVDGAWQSNPEVEFLKRFLVAIVKEAMRGDGDTKDPVLDEQDPERQLRVLMDEAIQLRGTLEKNVPDGEEEGEEGECEKGGAGPGATPGPAAAEVKKSATEVFRDHKLKTLFRWGKREP